MSSQHDTDPISAGRSNLLDETIQVGEDLAFQERWWKLERVVWMLFLLILIADVLGVFGRGWLANAKLAAPESGMTVIYERVQRSGTPSILRVEFAPQTKQDSDVKLFVSESLVRKLGAQRISPQPERSMIGESGILYSFPRAGGSAAVEFALNSSFPGVQRFTLQIPGRPAVQGRVVVMP